MAAPPAVVPGVPPVLPPEEILELIAVDVLPDVLPDMLPEVLPEVLPDVVPVFVLVSVLVVLPEVVLVAEVPEVEPVVPALESALNTHCPPDTHLAIKGSEASLMAFPVKSDFFCQCPTPPNHFNSSYALAHQAPKSLWLTHPVL